MQTVVRSTQYHKQKEQIMKPDARKEHPDQDKINDWFLNGPRDHAVEALVRELTIDHGLRLAEVEGLIIDALRQKLRTL